MRQLPVPPPYTPDDLQAIADALRLPCVQLWTVFLPCPGVTVVMGDPCPPGPLSVICCPLADAIQDSAREYLALLDAPAPRGSRGSGRAVLTRMGSTVKRIRRDLESLTADFQALDSETYMALTASSLTQYEQLRHLETWAGTQAEEEVVKLQWLLSRVEAALSSLEPNPGGRPSNYALHQFLRRLCFVYEWATGQRPALSRNRVGTPIGPLWRFIAACFTQLQERTTLQLPWGDTRQEAALYEQLRAVLTRAKQLRRMTPRV